jgi:hypothetical protein
MLKIKPAAFRQHQAKPTTFSAIAVEAGKEKPDMMRYRAGRATRHDPK